MSPPEFFSFWAHIRSWALPFALYFDGHRLALHFLCFAATFDWSAEALNNSFGRK